MTSFAILDLIKMYFDSSMTINYQENGRNCKIETNNLEIELENLPYACHGNTLSRVTSKSCFSIIKMFQKKKKKKVLKNL